MSSTLLPMTCESGNLTVFVAPSVPSAETPSTDEPDSSGSEFSTPPTSPRAEDSPESPPSTPPAPAQRILPPPPVDSVPTPSLVRTLSLLRPALTNPSTEYSHDSPPPTPPAPAQRTPLSPPVDSVPTPPPVRTLSPSIPTPTSSRAEFSHELLASTPQAPAQRDSPPPPVDSFPTPPLVRTVSPLLPTPMSSGAEYSHQLPLFTPLVLPPAVDSTPMPSPPVHVPALLLSAEVSQPPLVQVPATLDKAVSAPLQAPELSSSPPPVQVPPPQFEKVLPASNGSVLTLFWDAVARVQQAHVSLDEHISRWFGLDHSKYQWALNEYYESTRQEIDSGKVGNQEHNCKIQKV